MTDERLSLEQIHIIKNSLTALRKNKIDHVPIGEAIQFIIYSIWRPEGIIAAFAEEKYLSAEMLPREIQFEDKVSIEDRISEKVSIEDRIEEEWQSATIPVQAKQLSWDIGMSDEFIRSLRRVDKKNYGKNFRCNNSDFKRTYQAERKHCKATNF